MVSSITCSTLVGNESVVVEVEAQLLSNLRKFTIVGLPDSQLRESKERVRCAIENSGVEFPEDELIVNLGPASVPKLGVGFDLAVAVSILNTMQVVQDSSVANRLFLGELALDGSVRPCSGVLHAARLVKKLGGTELWVPSRNLPEASLVEGIKVVAVESLGEVVSFLKDEAQIEYHIPVESKFDEPERAESFADVRGQYAAKRALEIVAAGGHNLLMVGPPGSGKTMLAKRLTSILPPLERDEMVELTCLRSLGTEPLSLCRNRPFRSPHHSVSAAALVGGGSIPRPGEISLAHKGVLFLDELAEFKKSSLDCLRQPLEEQQVSISRAKSRTVFPADFTLVAAMNPPDSTYFENSIAKHLQKVSRPFLDRIDLQTWVSRPSNTELESSKCEDPTEEIRERVLRAREAQKERFGGALLNSRASADCFELTKEAKDILRLAVEKRSLSARGRAKAIKVGQTIADLEQSKYVEVPHISEALSYRL